MADDVVGGPGWVISGRTLRPVITDLAAFRDEMDEDPLAAAIEQLWSGDPLEALDFLAAHEPSPRVRGLRADCLRDLGRDAEAIAAYEQLVKEASGGPREAVMRQHYGKALLSAGFCEHARREFSQALELRVRWSNDDALVASSRQAMEVAEESCLP